LVLESKPRRRGEDAHAFYVIQRLMRVPLLSSHVNIMYTAKNILLYGLVASTLICPSICATVPYDASLQSLLNETDITIEEGGKSSELSNKSSQLFPVQVCCLVPIDAL
jgi:hypothetical protein